MSPTRRVHARRSTRRGRWTSSRLLVFVAVAVSAVSAVSATLIVSLAAVSARASSVVPPTGLSGVATWLPLPAQRLALANAVEIGLPAGAGNGALTLVATERGRSVAIARGAYAEGADGTESAQIALTRAGEGILATSGAVLPATAEISVGTIRSIQSVALDPAISISNRGTASSGDLAVPLACATRCVGVVQVSVARISLSTGWRHVVVAEAATKLSPGRHVLRLHETRWGAHRLAGLAGTRTSWRASVVVKMDGYHLVGRVSFALHGTAR